MFIVESKWWVSGYSLYNSFNISVYLNIFTIKGWEKGERVKGTAYSISNVSAQNNHIYIKKHKANRAKY